ncbi:hypothetical protein [Arthrospiribacter ruber]|uniref:Uncharacterized protein n=1 Tax=Arthrospiribacter ruber TaxID=2487934 RepID=A0A951J027_9BACT|nr:hypothetical protein [Arthrospiribacter ruber]MBW3470250.1 hypothetical protein [Arthrospiribacter ruber]
MSVLVFVLKWLQWKYLIVDNAIDIYVGVIAVFFTVLGIWLAKQLTKPKVERVIVEKEVYVPLSEDFAINQSALEALNLYKGLSGHMAFCLMGKTSLPVISLIIINESK